MYVFKNHENKSGFAWIEGRAAGVCAKAPSANLSQEFCPWLYLARAEPWGKFTRGRLCTATSMH